MYVPMRRSLGLVLGVLALLGPFNAKGQAQYAFGGWGLNPYVNPFGGGGYGYGSLLSGSSGEHGHDEDMGGGMLGSAGYGGGYGNGSGTSNIQWMMNPYQGYLQGTAELTRANAQYVQTIQQTRMTRQESIRASLQTRRATIEEIAWERAHMPDPEKLRQRTLERELSAARVSPPTNEIWSGRALNTLLRHLFTQSGEGAREPKVPIREDTAKHINVKTGDSSGNVALLKDKGELEWPGALQASAFKESRERFDVLMRGAYRSVDSGNNPDPATLSDLLDQFRKMGNTLKNNVSGLKPDEYIEAQRYLTAVGQTLKGLQEPNVGQQFREGWRPTKIRSVSELVKHMRDRGLLFAPAAVGDEAAYVALYHALAAFDSGMGRVLRTTR